MVLQTKFDDLKQYMRKFNLEICGNPEDEDENLEHTIMKLSECLNVDLRVKDIYTVDRLKKGNIAQKPIIVHFSNLLLRQSVK